ATLESFRGLVPAGHARFGSDSENLTLSISSPLQPPTADMERTCRQVRDATLVVACAADHPLAGRRLRDAKKLVRERWVAFAASRTRRETFATVVDERMRAAGLGAVERVHIDSLTAQKRFVEAGFGLALVVGSAIDEERRSGAVGVIDVPALEGKFPVVLVRRRDGYLSGAARALCQALGARLG